LDWIVRRPFSGHILKTEEDRSIVIMKRYIKVDTTDLDSSPNAPLWTGDRFLLGKARLWASILSQWQYFCFYFTFSVV